MGFRAFSPAWTMGSVLTTVMVVAVAPVQASELSAWSYSEATQLLEFSLPQSVLPRFFLLAEPTRIVLDIPTTQLGAVLTEQTYGGVVERIRVSQFEGDTVRMVIDLAPGTVLEERQAEIEFDDDINGQRRWRFRPRIDVVATEAVGEIASVPIPMSPPSETARGTNAAATSPEPIPELPPESPPELVEPVRTETPLADSPVSLENAEEISYSAAGLQLSAQGAAADALPIDLYAESNPSTTAEPVTVPPLASAPPVAEAAAAELPAAEADAARPTPPTTVEPGYVPPMVAPTLETVEDNTAPVTVAAPAPSPSTPLSTVGAAPPTEERVIAAVEPVMETAAEDVAPDAQTNPAAVTGEASVVVATTEATPPTELDLMPESVPVEAPPFIESDDAVAGEATPYTAAIVPFEPLPDTATAAIPEPSDELPIPVIEMGGETRTITQTGAPTVVQFGQPLPSN